MQVLKKKKKMKPKMYRSHASIIHKNYDFKIAINYSLHSV